MIFKIIIVIHAELFRKANPLEGSELGLPNQLFQKVIVLVHVLIKIIPKKSKTFVGCTASYLVKIINMMFPLVS